jgi:signal transduction histidine kinase
MVESEADFEQRLRDANEQLYKHSQELAVRNRTLSLLRQLYQISIQTLDPKALAQEIVHVVRGALEFEFVGVFVLDDAGTLTLIASDRSQRLDEALGASSVSLESAPIKHAADTPFFKDVFDGKDSRTKHLADVWGRVIDAGALGAVADSGHVKELSAHPLSTGSKLQGVLVFGLNREIENLSQFEQESIESLVDVTAVALDRARVYEALQQANEQQVVLIHFITHQIKGFVAKSRNIFSMLLEGDFGPVPDTMKPMLEEGFKSDTKGATTIQEILNASNIKSGKVTYAKETLDMRELVDSVVPDLKSAADAKGLALTVTAEGDDFAFSGDRMQLTNAVKNLIDNSIKYTPSGSVEVSLTRADDKVRLTIADTGVGITPEDMQNLFTEGGHGKESTKINVDSTGFGLYIVKNIVEAHHGRVWAESEGAGKGSRFIMELPVS